MAESRALHLFWREHLPRPEPQVEVYDESGRLVGRVDFLWAKYGVFGEMDGKLKYLTMRREGETLDEFLLREKRREEQICALTGWVCIRITWEDLARPRLLARRIRRLLDSRAPDRPERVLPGRSCRFLAGCNPQERPGYPVTGYPVRDSPYDTGRFSYGVLRTMVVRDETLAAPRMRARRSSRAPGVATRTLRM